MRARLGRRALSLFLALALCLGLLPMTAAAGYTQAEAIYFDGNRSSDSQWNYGANDGYLAQDTEGSIKFAISGGVPEGNTIQSIYLVTSQTHTRVGTIFQNGSIPAGAAGGYEGDNNNPMYNGVYITGVTLSNVPAGIYQTEYVTNHGSFFTESFSDQWHTAAGTIEVVEYGGSAAPRPTITTTSLSGGRVGESYSQQLEGTAADGSSLTWSLTSGSLPAGLSLDATTGAISGTPTAQGVESFTITAAQGNGETASRQLSITISAARKYTVRFYLNGGTGAEGFQDTLSDVQHGTEITLPAAPTLAGYSFSGWRYGDTTCPAGSRYTVTGRANFTAQWTEKAPVMIALPAQELGQLVGSYWVNGYFGSGQNEYARLYADYFSGTGNIPDSIPLSVWNFMGDHTSYSKLELCTYVDGEETVIAEYSGTVQEGSTGITLTKTGTRYAMLTSVAVADMKDPDDCSRSLIRRNGRTLYLPCLVSTASNGGYSTSVYGVWNSDKYALYDWENRSDYQYSFDAATGTLTVTVPRVEAPSVTVSGKVTFSGGAAPVAGVTVRAGQYYKGLTRTATATTGADGSYSLKIYPVEAYVTLHSGTDQLYFDGQYDDSYINSPSDPVTRNFQISYSTLRTSVQVQAAEGQEALVDRYLRGLLDTPMETFTVTDANGSDKKDTRVIGLYSRASTWDHTLGAAASAQSVNVKLDCDVFTGTNEKTVPIASARGSATFTPTLRPGAVVNLRSAGTSFPACMAWFDSAGNFSGKSRTFTVSSYSRDYAFVCPGDAGSYTLVLVPGIYDGYLKEDVTLNSLPEGAKVRAWSEEMATGKIAELATFAADPAQGLSAAYFTKPGSTLYASADSYSNTGEVVTFTGEIALDPGLGNGKLTALYIRTGVYSDSAHVWNTAPVQSLVIDGREYLGELSYSYHTAYYRIDLSGKNISLPCHYTLYCNPGDLRYDMDVTLTANVTIDGSFKYDQLIGSAVVKRPGAYLDTLSTYVNRKTVQISGRARPGDTVTIFDNGVLVGGAKADKWGEWSASVELDGVSAADATTHILTAVTGSGDASEELWIVHDPSGPQLTSFTMTWTEHGTQTINVGDPYTFYGYQMKDVTFTAVIDKPEALDVMSEWGGNVKAVTKVYTTDGEIRFLPMTQDGGAFTGKVDATLRDSISYAELMYVPKVPTAAVTAETVETVPQVSVTEFTGLLPAEGSVGALTAADNWTVTFDGDGPKLGGNTNGLNEDEFRQAADELLQRNLKLRSITMEHDVGGTEHSTLAWLNSICDQRKADSTECDVVYTFSGVLNDETAFENARTNVEEIAVATHGKGEDVLPFQVRDNAGHTLYRYILTDAWTYNDVTTYTYFVYATFIKSTVSGETPYTVFITAELAPDFDGYFRYTAEQKAQMTAASSRVNRHAALVAGTGSGTYHITLRGYLTTGTSSGVSSGNGPMYGYPSDRADYAGGQGSYGPPPQPNRQYHGKFDLQKEETYQQKQQNMLEDVSGNGSALFGIVGDGAGWIGTALGLVSYQKAIQRRNRYNGYASDMRWEIWQMDSRPCYGALNSTQKAIVQKLKVEINQAWGSYQLSNVGANLTDFGINLASIGGGLAGLSWKKGAALAVGGYAAGKANGGANDKVFNRFVQKYESAYKTIDSMMRNAADAAGNPDCKKDEKAKNSSTSSPRSSDGGSFPNNNDPSGIVYEGVLENPVEGAKVTLYYAANAGGSLVKEGTTTDGATGKKTGTGAVASGDAVSSIKVADDVRYLIPQEAVQITGADGRFSWGVPEGLWYVTAACAGMSGDSNDDAAATVTVAGLTVDGKSVTKLLPVLPVQLDVNIPLVDNSAPVVEDVKYTTEGIYVTFSKYMTDTGGGDNSVLTASNYGVYNLGSDTEALPVTVTSVEQGHTPTNRGESTTYTRTVLLKPDSPWTKETDLSLCINGTVTSYADTPMGGAYYEGGTVRAMEKLPQPLFSGTASSGAAISGTSPQAELRRGNTVYLQLPTNAPEGTVIYYTTDGSDPKENGKRYDGPIAVTGDMTIKAVSACVGYQNSEISEGSFTVTRTKAASDPPANPDNPGTPSAPGTPNSHTAPGSRDNEDSGENEITIPVSGEAGSIAARAMVMGGTAYIGEIGDTQISRVIGSGAGMVFDLRGLGDGISSVSIPTLTWGRLAKALRGHGGSVTVRTAVCGARFDEAAVQAVADRATPGNLILTMRREDAAALNAAQTEALDGREVYACYELLLTVNGKPMPDFGGGTVTVTVPLTPRTGVGGRNYAAWYAAESGALERRPSQYADRELSFTAAHFSRYAVTCEPRPFRDVAESAWYGDAVYYCCDSGYFRGVSETAFAPGDTMTRAMFATVLYRIAGEPEVTGGSPFSDVESGTWYADAVIRAAEQRIIEGYGDGTFGTNDPVTREQMVTLFWRCHGQPAAAAADLSGFSDADQVSDWAKDAFTWAVSSGVISGKGGGILDPKGAATRAEVAQIVLNHGEKVR